VLYPRLRQLIKPFSHTPFHPQWLILRGTTGEQRTINHWAKGTVIDVGCGDRWLASCIIPAAHYIGVDYPPTIAQGYPGHPDVFADAARLPFCESAAHSVLLMDVLEHLRSPEAAIKEAARILKTGGRLILQVPFMYPVHDAPNDYQRWTRDGLHQLMTQNGFKVAEFTSRGHPIETSAAMASMALAKSGLNALTRRRIELVLLPVIVVLIPVVNVFGWLMGKLLQSDTFMPLSYRLVAEKTG
jgi:SAM-dependent methyltransferase